MGGGDDGCGSGLLGVTSNKSVTFPRQNNIRPSGSCCSVWGMYTYTHTYNYAYTCCTLCSVVYKLQLLTKSKNPILKQHQSCVNVAIPKQIHT